MNETRKSHGTVGRDLALWVGVLGGPALWAVQLQAGYAIVPTMCGSPSHLSLLILTAGCITLALLGTLISYHQWKRAGAGSPDSIEGSINARRQFVGALGALVAVLFSIVMLAQGLASFFFNPCWN